MASVSLPRYCCVYDANKILPMRWSTNQWTAYEVSKVSFLPDMDERVGKEYATCRRIHAIFKSIGN